MKPPDSVGKKNETDGTRLRRGRQFHFFPDRIWTVLGRNLFYFFVCGQFHVKLDETGGFVFCFFGSKMKLAVVSWVKLAKTVKPSRFGREKN